MAISSSILPIDPNQLNSTGFELADQTIIPSQDITSTFDPNTDTIEFYIYDGNNNLINSNYNFRNYRIIKNSTGETSTDEIELFPAQDIQDAGFENGTLFGLYNFINLELNSSNDVPYFISEISSDRTEIRLKSNVIDNQSIETSFNVLKQKLDSADFFDEFYISFKDNEYYIAVNTLLQTEEEQFSVLIKLYQPLPPEYQLKDELYVVTKPAESQAFQVDFIDDFILQDDIQFLKGPNINIDLKKRISNSSDLKNKSELLNTSNSSSLFTLENLLDRKGVNLTPNFSFDTFNEFVHFSTAKSRINNFVYKVGQIQGFESNLDTLNSITGSTTSSLAYTENVASLNTKISNIIKNFDEYEYFLYYQSSSFTYPKSNDSYPYTLYPTSSTEVKTWLGSDVESDPFYGGALLSASLYDQSNQNNLYYTIPEFIRDNTDNNQYLKFVELAGQHFDQLWLYTSYLTEKLNSTNQLDKGVPLEIAGEVIKSLGYQTFGNNFDNQDLYFGLVGAASSSLLPPTGSELINNYVAVNAQNVIESTGFPYAIDDVNRELYKRLFHNMVYLAKKKGTISGLRQLLNIWGVPNTVLRISEFGGKDKINTNDWDYWYKRFNFELNTVTNNEAVQTDFRINPKWNAPDNRPGTVEFRFKTPVPNANTPQSQSLWSLDTTGKSRVVLEYEADFTSGSYSGSIINPEYQYANLKLFPNFFGESNLSASIRLPFFNNDFWNVVVTRDGEDFQLFSGNKIYNGSDGTKLGFFASSTISASSSGWTTSTISNFPDDSGDGLTNYSPFTGSYQEIRYYTEPISESVIRDHIMNPQSIEGNGTNGSYNTLAFRGSIGGELYTGSISVHPKVSGSFVTQSFYNGAISSSAFTINGTFSGSREFVFFDSPAAGIRTRVADKVRVPNVKIEGNVLSSNTSIQQNLLISQSYTENINNLEVAFSPQNEINDDIIQSIGFGDVQRILADPRNISSSLNFYPGLKDVAEDYFRKYFKSNQKDYLRLIRFIDNSLFKAAENYVPARTGISTGIVIKQHILERNRVRPPQPSLNTTLSPGFIFQNIQVSASIDTAFFSGSTGGSLNKYNFTGSGEFGQIALDQSYNRTVQTKSGSVVIVEDKQREFYDGEFSGSELVATTQNLNLDNQFKFSDYTTDNFATQFYEVEGNGSGFQIGDTIEITSGGSTITATVTSVSDSPTPGNEIIRFTNLSDVLPFGPPFPKLVQIITTAGSGDGDMDEILSLTIIPSSDFQNSNFDVLMNSINTNRTSKFHVDVDYTTDSVVPINRQNIIDYFTNYPNSTITLTQVPESNYTSKTFTTLRYDGSKNSANDYNITSSKGDLPPIQKNPIAFARFDSSFENRSVFGTRNYIIDSIIESPFENIVGTDVIPKIKRVSSNVNSNVLLPDSTLGVGVDPIEMSGFFEKNRDAIVIFDDLQVGELGQSELKNIRAKIFRGGYELGAIITNQNSVNSLQNFTFSTASWSSFSTSTVDRTTSFPGPGLSSEGFNYFLETGSAYYTANTSSLILRGGGTFVSQSIAYITSSNVNDIQTRGAIYSGPGLGLFHSLNYAVKNNIIEDGTTYRRLASAATGSSVIGLTGSLGIPALEYQKLDSSSPPLYVLGTSTVDPEIITNYWRFNFNQSNVETYKDLGFPFLIEPDDEIRVTVDLNSGSLDTPNFQTFNFTVTKVTTSSLDLNSEYGGYIETDLALTFGSVRSTTIFDVIEVTPNPSTLNIPNGTIDRFTITRNKNKADNVILFQTPFPGDEGALNPSTGGFLIPNDFTKIQKENALTLINQIREKNGFV